MTPKNIDPAQGIQGMLVELFASDDDGGIPAVTDVRVASGEPMKAYMPNGWQQITTAQLSDIAVREFLSFLCKDWEQRLGSKRAIEGSMTIELTEEKRDINLRCSIYTCDATQRLSVVIRLQPAFPPPLAKLGFGELITSFVRARSGLLVVSGPTSSGKSTTIAAICQEILDSRPDHVITIEEPIEYALRAGKGLVSQRQVPDDVPSFTEALTEAMRQRPDVLVVGEVRTREEAEIAIRAAEHGRYVMLTTHARSALGGLQKLLNFFPPDEVQAKAQALANTLIGAIHQQLVPSRDSKNRQLGYEIMFLQDETDALQHLAVPSRHENLQQLLVQGKLRRSTELNRILAGMVARQAINDTDAYAVAYDVAGLKKLIATGTGSIRPQTAAGVGK